MASTQGSVGSGKPLKNEKTRRGWTEREEEVLLASLKELVAQGWKSDNEFRPGYIGKLEAAMKKEFPHIDLKGKPHITYSERGGDGFFLEKKKSLIHSTQVRARLDLRSDLEFNTHHVDRA